MCHVGTSLASCSCSSLLWGLATASRTQRSEKSFTEITLFKMPVNVSAAAQTEMAAGGRFKSVALGPRV